MEGNAFAKLQIAVLWCDESAMVYSTLVGGRRASEKCKAATPCSFDLCLLVIVSCLRYVSLAPESL